MSKTRKLPLAEGAEWLPAEWAGLAECCREVGIQIRTSDESSANALEAQWVAIHAIGTAKDSPRGIQLRDFWAQKARALAPARPAPVAPRLRLCSAALTGIVRL